MYVAQNVLAVAPYLALVLILVPLIGWVGYRLTYHERRSRRPKF